MYHSATKHAQLPIFHRILQLVCSITLVIVLVVGMSAGSTTASAAEGSNGYTQDQRDALAYLNEIRTKIGLQPLRLNANITTAAELHATYYNINNIQPSLDAHKEKQGMLGFMGVSVIDRLKASGWQIGSGYYRTGEVMSFLKKSSIDAMNSWLDTAYHRQLILSLMYDEIGIVLSLPLCVS